MDRTRRLRNNAVLRDMVRENHVRVDELIYPLFVMEGENIVEPVDSMPGICQYSLDRMHEELNRVKEAGISAILIFGIPAHKDEVGSGAYDEHGIVQEAIRQIKKDYPDLVVIADVCLCEYTSHGHCGLVKDGEILNDETLPLLAASAVSYAKAGADIVAPSDMMDKRVGAIRQALDEAGFTYTPIMAHSCKILRPVITDRFVTQRILHRALETARPIRWTPPTRWKACAKPPPTSTRARTSSW